MNKRTIFIIVGAVIILILLFVWLYLMFFSDSSDSPSDQPPIFEFPDTSGTVDIPDSNIATTSDNLSDTDTDQFTALSARNPLRQITTKPVAGYTHIAQSSTTTGTVRYVEAGTGHIYDIYLSDGEEIRVNNETIAGTHSAAVSADGQLIAIHAGFNGTERFLVGAFSSSSQNFILEEINFSPTTFEFIGNTLMYDQVTNTQTIAYSFDIPARLVSLEFTVPFREATIVWGSSVSGPHLAYPKPSQFLEGFLVAYEDGAPSRLPIDGLGVVGFVYDNIFLGTSQIFGTRRGFLYRNNERINLPIITLPEKCDYDVKSAVAVCAHDFAASYVEFPDEWYRGRQNYSDSLWSIDSTTGNATNVINLEEVAGRPIDVVDTEVGVGNGSLFFLNRTDLMLWEYLLPQPPNEVTATTTSDIIR